MNQNIKIMLILNENLYTDNIISYKIFKAMEQLLLSG